MSGRADGGGAPVAPVTPAASAAPIGRLGLDLGGTKVVFALVGAEGERLAESRIEDWTTGDAEADLDALLREARQLVERSGVSLAGGGVSAPGPLDIPAGTIPHSPNLPGWQNVPLIERLETALGAPFALENDANCAALAEWRFGAGAGTRNMLFLTMSTGVGGGLVLDGELYRGSHFQAGEVGHMPVQLGGRRCHCGLHGCLEAYAGGAALADRIREDLAAGAKTTILELAGGRPEAVRAVHWTRAIRSGDAYALALREEFLDRLAQGLATLIATLDPQCVVLGTIVAFNPDLFLDPLRERVRSATWSELHGVAIEPAKLAAELPFYAAASAALIRTDPTPQPA